MSPHLFQQFFARKRNATVFGKVAEQLKLPGSQRDSLAVYVTLFRRASRTTEPKRYRSPVRVGSYPEPETAATNAFDARHQFQRVKWLGHVVIRAHLKPATFQLSTQSSKEQHGLVIPRLARMRAKIQSASHREHDVKE